MIKEKFLIPIESKIKNLIKIIKNPTRKIGSDPGELTEISSSLTRDCKYGSDTGTEQIREMVKSMEELKESDDTIFKIIKIIDDIAFQTNLLTISAITETWGSDSDTGRGFTVVAEEI